MRRVVVSVRNARVRKPHDREQSDLVATVAHELRSPLTGIKGFSSTLLTKWDRFSDEQRQLMLETIDADADRLTRLITELLDAARIDAGRLALRREGVDLDEIVRHCSPASSGGAAEPFEMHRRRPRLIWGDRDRLSRCSRTCSRTPSGTGSACADRVKRRGARAGDGVAIEVHDDGPGIAEERQRVFSRFWRSGPGAGSGLGMYIVAGIVEEHGGSIEIHDAEGGGANIRVWFPINEPDTMTD